MGKHQTTHACHFCSPLLCTAACSCVPLAFAAARCQHRRWDRTWPTWLQDGVLRKHRAHSVFLVLALTGPCGGTWLRLQEPAW